MGWAGQLPNALLPPEATFPFFKPSSLMSLIRYRIVLEHKWALFASSLTACVQQC